MFDELESEDQDAEGEDKEAEGDEKEGEGEEKQAEGEGKEKEEEWQLDCKVGVPHEPAGNHGKNTTVSQDHNISPHERL